jgi:hypothetical protein
MLAEGEELGSNLLQMGQGAPATLAAVVPGKGGREDGRTHRHRAVISRSSAPTAPAVAM